MFFMSVENVMSVIERQFAAEGFPQIVMIALIAADMKGRACRASLFHPVLTEMAEELCRVCAECGLQIGVGIGIKYRVEDEGIVHALPDIIRLSRDGILCRDLVGRSSGWNGTGSC